MSSKMSITGITVSVDIADKDYGNGTSRFMSLSAKVNEGDAGIPLDQPEDALDTGIQLYMTAWETLMQGRYADGGIKGPEYRKNTLAALIRIQKVRTLYQRLKSMTLQELDEQLKVVTPEKVENK